MRVLVIEDDTTLGHALQEFLADQGYVVDWLTEGDRVLGALAGQPYDLLLLDLNLPGMSGLDVLRQLRQDGNQVPVLILTARDGIDDRVAGLDAGADDYVTKPFELPELAARVRARSSPRRTAQPLIEVGPLSFDTVGREVRANGQRLALSVRELSVLEMLMARVGRVVTKRQIVNSLSAWDADFSENAVEVYVPPAQAPGRHRRQHPDGAWFRLYAGCRSGLTADRGRLAPAATILPPTLRAPGHDAGTHSSRRRSGLAPAAPSRSLARHLVIRLMPPILLLVLLDLIATWVITHKIEMSMWMLEDFLWLMVLGQIVLIVMFTWVVVQGVRSGLRSVNHLSEEIRQRSIDDMQPLEVAGVPVEIEPLVTHTNDLLLPGRLAGGAAALHRPCGPSVAHAAVRPAAGVRADAGAAAAGRCARGPSASRRSATA